MDYLWLLVVLMCSNIYQGDAQREFYGPPTTNFTAFLAFCFEQNSTSVEVNWRSVIDFIVFHTSWYDVSNMGLCAPGLSLNFTAEVDCWKDAFGDLISASSPELQVARTCLDNVGEHATGRRKRSTDPFIAGTSLDSMDCPAVVPQNLTSRVLSAILPGTLAADDKTLGGFESIIEFVVKAGLCNGSTCNRCNVRHLNVSNPSQPLRCNQCWSTRLAGMIKNSSPLKIPVTNAVMQLGNNPQITGPPPTQVNLFFASCISGLAQDGLNWFSIVDFIILHSSWYDNSNVGACAFSPNVQEEASCWNEAFSFIISSKSQLLEITRACVDQFVAFTSIHSMISRCCDYAKFQNLIPPALRHFPKLERECLLDSSKCPSVRSAAFIQSFMDKLQETTIPSDFYSTDTTLQDLNSVIAFVREAGLCQKPTCTCGKRYASATNPWRVLTCDQCWPTRLAAIIKDSSPLKVPANFAVIEALPDKDY